MVIIETEQAKKLDELADLCEYWKRHRSSGRTPNSIGAALVMMAKEIVATTMPANAELRRAADEL